MADLLLVGNHEFRVVVTCAPEYYWQVNEMEASTSKLRHLTLLASTALGFAGKTVIGSCVKLVWNWFTTMLEAGVCMNQQFCGTNV